MAKKDIFIRLEERNLTLIDELAKTLGLSRSATTALLISIALKHVKNGEDIIRENT